LRHATTAKPPQRRPPAPAVPCWCWWHCCCSVATCCRTSPSPWSLAWSWAPSPPSMWPRPCW